MLNRASLHPTQCRVSKPPRVPEEERTVTVGVGGGGWGVEERGAAAAAGATPIRGIWTETGTGAGAEATAVAATFGFTEGTTNTSYSSSLNSTKCRLRKCPRVPNEGLATMEGADAVAAAAGGVGTRTEAAVAATAGGCVGKGGGFSVNYLRDPGKGTRPRRCEEGRTRRSLRPMLQGQ